MSRILLYVVIPLVAALASVVNLIHFRLDQLLRPSWPPIVDLTWYAAFAVVALATVGAIRSRDRNRRAALALWLSIGLTAGFVPRVADAIVAMQEQARDQAEGAEIEMEYQAAFLDWSDEIAAAAGPVSAEKAYDFLSFAAGADLGWRSLPDHTPEAFALVRDALAAGILDPDALAVPPTADSPAVTLTLLWYDRRIRPGAPHAIEKNAWNILVLLVSNGADLSSDDAAPLRADLARTVVSGEGRYIGLE